MQEALADCARRGGAILIGSVCMYVCVYQEPKKHHRAKNEIFSPLCLCVCLSVCVRTHPILKSSTFVCVHSALSELPTAKIRPCGQDKTNGPRKFVVGKQTNEENLWLETNEQENYVVGNKRTKKIRAINRMWLETNERRKFGPSTGMWLETNPPTKKTPTPSQPANGENLGTKKGLLAQRVHRTDDECTTTTNKLLLVRWVHNSNKQDKRMRPIQQSGCHETRTRHALDPPTKKKLQPLHSLPTAKINEQRKVCVRRG